ncbi:nitrous oxide reductase family maturation protein NosD [Aquisalimonas sp.]|uniref:nitrous oxide reductase family maturation protein NosD n=1 Tax=Aquisalimonas sp. TaxID=1872621 RepID=UPI0025C3CB6B|nr:nitrous oxide reductase family maturation protein NosD [Aquisalimonas sp.]
MIKLTALLLLLVGTVAGAATPVSPGELSARLAEAEPGDVLVLEPGEHPGGMVIATSITLKAKPGAVLDGAGDGHVLRINAADVTVDGLHLRNGGANLTNHDAAIYVEREAERARIQNNRIEARGFGIWLRGTPGVLIADNHITGDTALRSQDRGNGIHLYNVSDATVSGNTVCETRDGIYIDVSNDNRLEDNILCDQRYGIHYMFSHRNTVKGNRTRGNRTGFALMQSRDLEIVGNHSQDDAGYGFLLNHLTHSLIADNTAVDIRHSTSPGSGGAIRGGEGKALFIYNSQLNTIRGNIVARTDIGIHLTAGSENNSIHGNALLGNRTQVKYVATRTQEWSEDGRGNYWSDYLGWDLAGDGIGDVPHEPNDAVDRILWTYPMARVLMNSPAVQLLRWVQRAFPVLRPSGVTDSAPLMRPPRGLQEAE